jgi:hypothetical protein
MADHNQTDSKPVDGRIVADLARKLTVIACCAFALSVLYAIVSLRCLYADGSYQLIEALKAGGFVAIAKNRHCASCLFQLPVVAAIKLGIRNLHALQLAFGLGCFLQWPVTMWSCYRMAPRHFWVIMLACAAGYLNTAFMAVGEYIVADAFFWPVLFAILFVRPLTPLAAGMLVFSTMVLLFSYESLLFLGPPLALLALWRAMRGGEKRWQSAVLFLAAILLCLAAGIALDGVLYPQSPANLGGFKRGLKWMLTDPGWTLGWTFVWLALMVAVCLGRNGFTRKYYRLELALLAGAILLWGAWPILEPDDIHPAMQHEFRSIHLLVPLALLVVSLILTRRPKWLEEQRHYLIGFSSSLLLAQSLWHIAATWQWQEFVGVWRSELASQAGAVSLSDIPWDTGSRQAQALRFDWNWADPDLSIMLAPGGRVRAMILPGARPAWRPFDPLDPQALPNLQRYGVDYSNYVVALKNRKR